MQINYIQFYDMQIPCIKFLATIGHDTLQQEFTAVPSYAKGILIDQDGNPHNDICREIDEQIAYYIGDEPYPIMEHWLNNPEVLINHLRDIDEQLNNIEFEYEFDEDTETAHDKNIAICINNAEDEIACIIEPDVNKCKQLIKQAIKEHFSADEITMPEYHTKDQSIEVVIDDCKETIYIKHVSLYTKVN